MGYEYICITDHTGNLAIAHALDLKRLKEQRKEIEKVRKRIKGISILQGVEVNITQDGGLDMPDKVLKEMDLVLASVHSSFRMPKERMTKRIIKAMENENVDIIAHPTGRIISRREPYEIELDEIFDSAKRTRTILEIDCYPDRMDLKDIHVRAAIKAGVKLSIGTDAHNTGQLKFMKLGMGTARRGWARKEDVINTRSLNDMMKMLKH